MPQSNATTDQPPLGFFEEVDQNSRPTGIEYEPTQEITSSTKPYDPDLIRVDPKTFSLRQILDMIDDGDLQLDPDFQRLKVWTPVQKSRLIESVLLRIPLPAFYFSADRSGGLQVVDGLQRLSTIHDFVRGGKSREDFFPLVGLEYLEEQLHNLRFDEIESPLWTRRINSTQIIAHVIDPQTPYGVKFDIFRRINTGGSPLNTQEIRHCLSSERTREFLKQLTSMPSFDRATHGVLKDHVRMVDREVVLRYCAFRRFPGLEAYAQHETMDEFLNTATQRLSEASDTDLHTLKSDFDRAMENAFLLFGKHAFRKWPLSDDRLCPFNRALFDVFSVLLANFHQNQLRVTKDKIVTEVRSMMTRDRSYASALFIDSISASTGDIARVKARFHFVRDLLNEAI